LQHRDALSGGRLLRRHLTPPFEHLVGIHVLAACNSRNRRARLQRLSHNATLQCLRPVPTPARTPAPLSVHQLDSGHLCSRLCHPPIIAPSDDQRQASCTERLRFNALADQSDKDEQQGFMMMFSGAVAGQQAPTNSSRTTPSERWSSSPSSAFSPSYSTARRRREAVPLTSTVGR